jgi:hypothetical protein
MEQPIEGWGNNNLCSSHIFQLFTLGHTFNSVWILNMETWKHIGGVEVYIAPCILNLGTSWRWVVSFMFHPLYPSEKNLQRLGGPQSWLGCSGREKNFFPCPPRNWTLVIQPIV